MDRSKASLSDFQILTKLGQGSFGQVYKVKKKQNGSIYVIKQIDIGVLSRRQREEAQNECIILSKLNNPYIVKYYDSFVDRKKLNIVMEYCEHGDLSQLLRKQMGRPLREKQIWKFFIQMCLGLEYLHSKKVLHRDVKTLNMFLTKDDSIRIGDLGVAKVLTHTANFAKTMVGTPYYLSPELCQEKPYNAKTDVWALGCVLYEIITHRHPFQSTNQGALILKIIRGRYDPIPATYSSDLASVVSSCLTKDYKKRLDVKGLLELPCVKTKRAQLNIPVEEVASLPGPSYFASKKEAEEVKKLKKGSDDERKKAAAAIGRVQPEQRKLDVAPPKRPPMLKVKGHHRVQSERKPENKPLERFIQKPQRKGTNDEKKLNEDPKPRVRKGAPLESGRSAVKQPPAGPVPNLYKKTPSSEDKNIKIMEVKNVEESPLVAPLKSSSKKVAKSEVDMVRNLPNSPNQKDQESSENQGQTALKQPVSQMEMTEEDFQNMFEEGKGEEMIQPQWEIKQSKDGAIPVIKNTFYGQEEMKVEEVPESGSQEDAQEEEEQQEDETKQPQQEQEDQDDQNEGGPVEVQFIIQDDKLATIQEGGEDEEGKQQMTQEIMNTKERIASLKEDIKGLKKTIRELEKNKKRLVRQALEIVTKEQYEQFYEFFLKMVDQEQLSEKDEEKINEHIYAKHLPQIMSYTMMKIIHNEVEKNKATIDLAEKEALLPK